MIRNLILGASATCGLFVLCLTLSGCGNNGSTAPPAGQTPRAPDANTAPTPAPSDDSALGKQEGGGTTTPR